MIETYYLDKEQLPTIPTPHDSVVTDIHIENQCIVFRFEENVSEYDAINVIRPDAKSLIIRYHLIDEDSFSIYRWHKPIKLLVPSGYYKSIDNSALSFLAADKYKLEYLYHNLGYRSIITKLFSRGYIIIDAEVDYVEFEWIE
ncbi:MAG: hypothetical protein J6A05_08975 [Oscillospiraceae bacterium]|nr:hypothetical protein [Oscillospiraceae bacterium]MBR4097211.1 hypothetical protein [Oscillospiraceae bacterium]